MEETSYIKISFNSYQEFKVLETFKKFVEKSLDPIFDEDDDYCIYIPTERVIDNYDLYWEILSIDSSPKEVLLPSKEVINNGMNPECILGISSGINYKDYKLFNKIYYSRHRKAIYWKDVFRINGDVITKIREIAVAASYIPQFLIHTSRPVVMIARQRNYLGSFLSI